MYIYIYITDKDECANDADNDCGPHTTCVNASPGYTCTCDENYLPEDDNRNCYSKCLHSDEFSFKYTCKELKDMYFL